MTISWYGMIPPFSGAGDLIDERSMYFENGTSAINARSAVASVGIANAWSIAYWHLRLPHEAHSNTATSVWIAPDTTNGTGNSSIRIRHPATTDNCGYIVVIQDNTGAAFKTYNYNDFDNCAYWTHVVVTWSGTVLLLYQNAVAITATSTPTDVAVVLGVPAQDNATNRAIGLNAAQNGFAPPVNAHYHSIGIVSSVLTSTEITALYASGAGYFNLGVNSGNYTSQANLQHWYRLAYNQRTLALMLKDYRGAMGLDDATAGLSTANVSIRFPARYTPVAGQSVSLNFNGEDGSDARALSSEEDLGIANEWTVGCWFRYNGRLFDTNTQHQLFQIRIGGVANNENRINMFLDWTFAAGALGAQIDLHNSVPTNTKLWFWDPDSNGGADFVDQGWHYIVLAFDGTQATADEFDVYLDGTDIGSQLTKTNDSATTMTNTTRAIHLGSNFTPALFYTGAQHQFQIWSTKLSSAAITSLYASGVPENLDLNGSFGSYSASGSLEFWLKLGLDSTDIAKNYATTPPSTPTWTYTEISKENIVNDFPSSGYPWPSQS